MQHDRFVELIELFGGTEWQKENVARGFVSQAEYLISNKNKQITKHAMDVQIAEQNRETGYGNVTDGHRKSRRLQASCEIELEDLKAILEVFKRSLLYNRR